MNIDIVVGLGFGDEGKGGFTDYLCEKKPTDTLVVRFNGGHQAGHTVWTKNGENHVFSNFGAGTLQGVPTYWSQHCTVFASALLKELKHITQINPLAYKNKPILYLDNLCPLTTHYDLLANRVVEDARETARHGSCGVGFGATIARHIHTPLKFYAQDMLFEDICRQKLQNIRDYYASKIKDFGEYEHDEEDERFLDNIKKIQLLVKENSIKFVTEKYFFEEYISNKYKNIVFEGAQGILLDMDFGFFPNVTRSNTTSKNAITLIEKYLPEHLKNTNIYYITRCYQTRHGAGVMANEIVESEKTFVLKNNEHETNQTHDYQGHFRKGFLNIDWLKYAIFSDKNFSHNLPKNLVLTCLDQMENPHKIPYILGNHHENEVLQYDYTRLKDLLGEDFKKCFYSFGKVDKWEVKI